MIKTKYSVHGHHRLNTSSEVICDSCGVVCTDKFFDIFINEVEHNRGVITASYPFKEGEKKNKQLCEICLTNKIHF